MKRLLKALRYVVIGFVALFLALSAFFQYIHYPNVIAAVRLGLAPASKTPTLMPWHTVAPSTSPALWATGSEAMPATVNYEGKEIAFQDFLTKSYTDAFLVVRNGKITYEYYNNKAGITPTTQLPSYSMAKTLTSIVIGQLIHQGKIHESDTFVSFFPQWRTGGAFDKVTIQSLLDMEAGVGVKDNYPNGPAGWGVGIAQMYATTDMNWFISHNRKMLEAPDTKPEYRSVDSQMLGLIIQKVTGTTVSDYFSKNVWQLIGATNSATWNVDHVGGHEKTFCCFNAAARDYALVGELFINNGASGTHQVIDASWLKRLSTPAVKLDYGWGYGAQVWHPYPGINLMMGLHGQQVFADPATKTVIVKLSDFPNGDDPQSAIASVLYPIAEHPAKP
jgi:CubicO group peptidase (beta-lactamase class C family)